MATINEMQNSMTVYFSKSSGEIKGIATGVQDMSLYGPDADDYSIIWSHRVYPMNQYIMKNSAEYKVDLETFDLKRKQLEVPVDVVQPI